MESHANSTMSGAEQSYGLLIPAAIITAFGCIISVVGNVSVIVAVALSKRLQTITNVFVVSVACSDIVNSCLFVIQTGAVFGAFNENHITCAVTGAFTFISNCCNIFTLILIAFNRYFLITQPTQRYRRVFTKRNIFLITLFTVAFPTIVLTIFISLGWASLGLDVACMISEGNPLKITVCATFGCLMILITFFYLKIYLYVRKNVMIVRDRNEIRITGSTSVSQPAEAPSTRNERPNEERAQRDHLEPAEAPSTRNERPNEERAQRDRLEPAEAPKTRNERPNEETAHRVRLEPAEAPKTRNERPNEERAQRDRLEPAEAPSTRNERSNEVRAQRDRLEPAGGAPSTRNERPNEKAHRDRLGPAEAPSTRNERPNERAQRDRLEPAEAPSTRNERPNEERAHRDRLETKITQNMLVVVICFFVCNVPITLTFFPGKWLSPTVTMYFYTLYSLHSCVSPLVYASRHPVFRQVFRCMLSRDLRAVEQPSRWLREWITSR